MHGLIDCTYSVLHCSYFLRFARILSSVICFFISFLIGNMPIKQKVFTFFMYFFHGKLGFVCQAASVEDVSSLGSIGCCFLILITFFSFLPVFVNTDFEVWVLNVCKIAVFSDLMLSCSSILFNCILPRALTKVLQWGTLTESCNYRLEKKWGKHTIRF